MLQKNTVVELMAPAGSFETLMAAIQAGADSVYFGVEQLNMRACSSNNFTINDIKRIAELAKIHNIKAHITLNTVMYEHDLALMRAICNAAKEAGISAIIASDIAVIQYATSIGMPVHISTQANISNIEAVRFYAGYAEVIVLARELTLQQIKSIHEQILKENISHMGNLVRLEVFAHGAMCVAISGKCYMSLATYNASANRGACQQNCRRAYRVIDEETGDELVIDNKYVMSPKDLSTIAFIDKLIDAGVSVLKIEGRARKADYVFTTVKAYREAIDSYYNGTYSSEKVAQWLQQLKTVYNRGLWDGYYLGKSLGEWSGSYGSQATKEKSFVGRGKDYFSKKQIAEFYLEAGSLCVGDSIIVTGATTGIIEAAVESMYVNDNPAREALKGDTVTMPLSAKIRPGDKLFVVSERKY